MANLNATPGWDDVPELDINTPARGGPGGPMNAQAQALLNRTEALRRLADGEPVPGFGAKLTSRITDSVSASEKGAVPGDQDQTDAFQEFLSAAAGGAGTAKPGIYLFRKLSIPAYSTLSLAGVTLRSDGSLTGSDGATLTIGDHCIIDELRIDTPGTEGNSNIVEIGAGTRIGRLIVCSDTQRSGGGIITRGQDVVIDYLETVNIDRPLHVDNSLGAEPTTGFRLGFARIRNYVRGLRLTHTNAFHIGGFDMRGRSANASKSPGHNGILIIGSSNGEFGDGWIGNAGEHAIRIGGSTVGATRNLTFGRVVAYQPGGCAFKINDGDVRPANISADAIIGIDVGDTTLAGNSELLRLTNCSNINIGYAAALRDQRPASCQAALKVNNVDGLWIGHLHSDTPNSGVILFDQTSDGTPGNISNVFIDRLTGTSGAGNNAIGITMPDYAIGGVFICGINLTGLANNLLRVNGAAPTFTDTVLLEGRISGSVDPGFQDMPASEHLVLDIAYKGWRYQGRAGAYNKTGRAAMAAGAFDPNNISAGLADLYLNALDAAAVEGGYGGSIGFSRPGSSRRGAAIAAKQTGSESRLTGLSFFVGRPGPTSSNAVYEALLLHHTGDAEIIANGAGLILRSPNGARYKVTVDDAGALQATAV